MTRPWQTISRVDTDDGALELRQRGDADFLITIAGRVLMTSQARRSEEALATLPLRDRAPRAPLGRVLVGGLGMGYTLRAALDLLPRDARVTVVELNRDVAAWCKGPLAPLTAGAASDPRVTIDIADVSEHLARAPRGSYDAIILDLYEGPHAATQSPDDPLYGPRALARARAALGSDGVFAVWSEEPDARFERRLVEAGFRAEKHRAGRGGRAHTVYLGYTSH
jgi:spermidine synthase